MVGCVFMSHRQQGHLETAPPFTVPCKEREARFLHRSHWESKPWVVAWQSITLALRHASSTQVYNNMQIQG